jgi:hypothetical protein
MKLSRRSAVTIPLALLLLWTAAPASASRELIFRVADPEGDDHGDGSLHYPLRSDMEPGDLDLVEFEALRVKDGTLFRFGFYTMNIDIYVDTDRKPGSGAIAMLPGRLAEVDTNDAWEKTIALTPRPNVLRSALERMKLREWKKEESTKRSLTDREIKQRRKQITEEFEPIIFFPNQVRVLGRRLEAFVPDGFFGGPARPEWGYTLVISGALLDQRLALPLFGRWDREFGDGLVVPVVPGRDREAFGGGLEGEPLQPPLIDILRPSRSRPSQRELLRSFDSATGRRVVIPAVVPTEL